MDNLPDGVRGAVELARGLPGASEATAAIDGSVSAVVHELSKAAAVASETATGYADVGSAHYEVLRARLAEADEAVFRWPTAFLARAVAEQPYATAAVGGAIAVVMLPGTRALLWRASFGRMQSEEVRQY